jgi:hypothetical protein
MTESQAFSQRNQCDQALITPLSVHRLLKNHTHPDSHVPVLMTHHRSQRRMHAWIKSKSPTSKVSDSGPANSKQ